MEQNTEEWLAWRRNGLGGSDLPVLMGDSPYSTPRQLWLEKTGKQEREENESMKFILNRGHEVEAIARNKYEIYLSEKLGKQITFPPILVENEKFPHFRASLDGYSKELNACWECKYIGKEGFEQVKAGICPPKYKAQVHWQIFLSGAKENHLVVMNDEQEMAFTIIKPDLQYIEEIVSKAHEFWRMIQDDVAPPLIHDDKLELGDEVKNDVEKYFELDAEIKDKKKKLDAIKARIFKKAGHTNCFYEGEKYKLTAQVQERKGGIDSERLYKHFEIDDDKLDEFRKPNSKSKVIKVYKKKEEKND